MRAGAVRVAVQSNQVQPSGHRKSMSHGAIQTVAPAEDENSFSKSAPPSPVQFRSPGTALMSLGRYVLDEPDDEPQVARNLNLNQQPPVVVARPVITMKATRVLSRPPQQPQQAQYQQPAPTFQHQPSRSAPIRQVVVNPPAPILEHTRRGLTVPIGASGGALPRFMQSTAAARQRTTTETSKPAASAPIGRQQPLHRQASAPTAPQQYKQLPKQVKNPPLQQQENNQNNRYHVTIPETPQWLRNSRSRGKARVLSTEEKEMLEVEEKKRKLAEIAKRNRERLGMMQGVAQHENRYQRSASAFTPKKTASKPPASSRNVTQMRPTVPQAFSFATDRRR